MPQLDPLKKELEGLLKQAKEQDAARDALTILFPKIGKLLNVPMSTLDTADGQRTLRRSISKSDFSSAYFRLDPQPATWGKAELDEIISSDPQSAFSKLNERLRASDPGERARLLRIFLETLGTYFQAKKGLNQAWLQEILDHTKEIVGYESAHRGLLFHFDNFDRLRVIVIKALEVLDEGTRARLLSDSIPNARDTSVLCDVFRSVEGDLRTDGATRERYGFTFGRYADPLREQILSQVRELARTGEIWDQTRPGSTLWFWWGCDQEAEVRAFTTRAMRDPVGLNYLFEITINKVHSSAGDFERVDTRAWSKIVDLIQLKQIAHQKFAFPTDRTEQARAARFLAALEKGDEDKF